jgi:hypothetical protein
VDSPFRYSKWTWSWSGSEFGSGSELGIRPEIWALYSEGKNDENKNLRNHVIIKHHVVRVGFVGKKTVTKFPLFLNKRRFLTSPAQLIIIANFRKLCLQCLITNGS